MTTTSENLPPKPGAKVRFMRIGLSVNAAFLQPYAVYTVKRVDIGMLNTTVRLVEFPDKAFNSETFDIASPLDIVQWFDPHSKTHLKAYEQLCQTGCWPEDFIPEDPLFPTLWQVSLTGKIAQCWIEHQLG